MLIDIMPGINEELDNTPNQVCNRPIKDDFRNIFAQRVLNAITLSDEMKADPRMQIENFMKL